MYKVEMVARDAAAQVQLKEEQTQEVRRLVRENRQKENKVCK